MSSPSQEAPFPEWMWTHFHKACPPPVAHLCCLRLPMSPLAPLPGTLPVPFLHPILVRPHRPSDECVLVGEHVCVCVCVCVSVQMTTENSHSEGAGDLWLSLHVATLCFVISTFLSSLWASSSHLSPGRWLGT